MDFLKTSYYAGSFECFRRGTKIRELESEHDDIYEKFINRHPGFKGALGRYQENLITVYDRLDKGGIFQPKEKKRLSTSIEALVDTMGK